MKEIFKVRQFEAKTLLWWKARRKQIDMKPPYQRKGRLWSTSDKAYLIDSILNEFDVPKIYMADFTYADTPLNNSSLPYAIIDGKQRFEAIFDFFDGKLSLNDDFVYFEDESLKLGGLGYKDLQSNYPPIAEAFDTANLSVMSVISNSIEKINELFVRLNRSKPLTGAEIRNAMGGPVPEVIRSIAQHSFFANNISFRTDRMQDSNAAAKLLMFEFYDEPTETKKKNLDLFVEAAADDKATVDLSAFWVSGILDNMAEIFLPKDRLLASAGIVPVYYWFCRHLRPNEFPRVREFLIRFEEKRKENRRLLTEVPGDVAIDRELVEFDNFNRSTNDARSHVERALIFSFVVSRAVNNSAESEIVGGDMGRGDSIRRIFEKQQLRLLGAPLTIYKQWGTEEMAESSSVAIREGDTFQFAADTDIQRGDVIQLENAKSFFRVDDVDEIPQFNVIHHLDVRVTKIDGLGNDIRISNAGHAIFNGPVTGGVQIGGSRNTQNLNITTNPDLNNSLEALLKLIQQSDMDELDKEDYEAAVKRLGELAGKPKSEGVLKRIKEKFDFIDSAVKMGKLGAEALQYLALIGTALGLS